MAKDRDEYLGNPIDDAEDPPEDRSWATHASGVKKSKKTAAKKAPAKRARKYGAAKKGPATEEG